MKKLICKIFGHTHFDFCKRCDYRFPYPACDWIEHTPMWAGDGYFCKYCMQPFKMITEKEHKDLTMFKH